MNLFISPSSVSTKFSLPVFIDSTNPLMSIIDGPTIMQSSAYVKTIVPFPMYKHGYISEGLNYWSTSDFFSFSYQL